MTLASFKQCPSCNSSITEAFLDAVLALKHPDILSAFKVFAACMIQESIFSSCFTQLCSGGSPYALCSCGAVLIAPLEQSEIICACCSRVTTIGSMKMGVSPASWLPHPNLKIGDYRRWLQFLDAGSSDRYFTMRFKSWYALLLH
jgi:hypothetical protein